MEDLTGKQFGPYKIISPLGEGGMAAVYKAYQLGKINRHVALKVLPKQLAKEPEYVARFNQEARMLADLRHPRIMPVFDFGESDGYTYIVMPFVESGTLADILHGKPLPLPQICNIVLQIAEALDYAHDEGLIHRDVKPSNILIDERGNCLLTDFGISKMVEGTEQLTSTGGILGTFAYMSPEQGSGKKIDGRSDIYSLGVVLYEMATGRVPFRAETPFAIIYKHIQDPLPPPRTINPELSDAMEQIITKALAKNPEQRYQTGKEIALSIQSDIPQATPSISPAPTVIEKWPGESIIDEQQSELPEPNGKTKTNKRKWWVVLALAVLVLVALLFTLAINTGIFINPLNNPPPQTDIVDTTSNIQTNLDETEMSHLHTTPTTIPITKTPTAIQTSTTTQSPTSTLLPGPSHTVTPYMPMISNTGDVACKFLIGQMVHTNENARLWSEPDVKTGSFTPSLPFGTILFIINGPVWGPIRQDIDYSGWFWEVSETQNGNNSGWLWEDRIDECP